MYQLASGHPSGKIYQKVTKRNYLAYFDDYMAVKEAHLEWFLPEAARLGGYDIQLLDYSSDSLVTIWSGLISSIKMIDYYSFDGLENSLPLWVYAILGSISDKNGTYSPDSLWLMDGMAYYLGDVYVKSYPNDFEWKPYAPEFYNRVKHGLLPSIVQKYNQDLLCNPFSPVLSACIDIWHPDFQINTLSMRKSFDYLTERYLNMKDSNTSS